MTISFDTVLSFLTIACCVLDRIHLVAVAFHSLQDDYALIRTALQGDNHGK